MTVIARAVCRTDLVPVWAVAWSVCSRRWLLEWVRNGSCRFYSGNVILCIMPITLFPGPRPARWILDERRHPVPVGDEHVWKQWMRSHNQRVAHSTLNLRTQPRRGNKLQNFEKIVVSTLFVGTDNSDVPGAPPQVFETLVIGGPHQSESWRWATWDEAEAGHWLVVNLLKEKQRTFFGR